MALKSTPVSEFMALVSLLLLVLQHTSFSSLRLLLPLRHLCPGHLRLISGEQLPHASYCSGLTRPSCCSHSEAVPVGSFLALLCCSQERRSLCPSRVRPHVEKELLPHSCGVSHGGEHQPFAEATVPFLFVWFVFRWSLS